MNPGTSLRSTDGKNYYVVGEEHLDSKLTLTGDFIDETGGVFSVGKDGDTIVLIEDGAPEGTGAKVTLSPKTVKASPKTIGT